MVLIPRFLIGLVVLCLLAACAPSPATSSGAITGNPAAAATGRTFVEAMSRGDWASAAAMMDPSLAGADAASHLQQTGALLVAQYGPFQSIGGVTTTAHDSGTLVGVAVTFANATVTLDVSVNAAGQVVGLHQGAVVTGSAPPATYVKSGSFTESDVTVGAAPWALPGTLTVPTGPGPFPAVVLIAGSGPQDRDETLGPNKPLRDLAWGLASAGIVVLRYDKRTLVYGPQVAALPNPTVREETTDDAVAAVALLRQTPKVDPAWVFLVGHSLGATLAPRIAAQIPGQLAGIGMLEAASTPLADLMLIQVQYLASLNGSPAPSAAAQIDALRAAVALADSPSLSPSTPASELPGNVPASYWLDLRTYHPLAVAASLSLPIFLSQGQRDYQVPPSELGPWQQALAGHSNVTVKTYPDMDHLLLDGSGPATPAEYSVPRHVDAQLVADLAAWVASH
jgi:dienelactone hydrolase